MNVVYLQQSALLFKRPTANFIYYNMKKNYQGKILKKLANLQFAIGLLFTIGVLIAIGTIIEQDQSLLFYKESYPDTKPLLGFFDWQFIKTLNLDHVYTAWWFVSILVLFVTTLLACTFTTQLPSLKKFKLWKFLNTLPQFQNLSIKDFAKLKFSNALSYQCNINNYHIFRQNKKNYAYAGLFGRIAPVMVHGSIVLLLVGSTLGSFSGYSAQEIIPRGELFHIQNLLKAGQFSFVPQEVSCRVNDFWITYTSEVKTDQFYSDLSLVDNNGYELKRKTVFVNEPMVYNGLTFYQTDWDIVGIKLKLPNQRFLQIPLKKITKGGKKFWFGSLNLDQKNFSIVVNDLQGRIFFYDSKGLLMNEVLIGQEFLLGENDVIQVYDFITSTGLQIKADPGIFTVYFSFLLLMVSIYVSFFTYSQIWLVEKGTTLLVGGKSNRAVLFFQEEFRRTLKKIKT